MQVSRVGCLVAGQPSMSKYPDVAIERNVPARMRDGVTLYADIYRPESDEPLPVVLMRLPYDKTSAESSTHIHPLWYARQGYVVVVQDTRGRGMSEGEFYPFQSEAEDGYDTVEWAARLPGSSAKVGMYGFSYTGATQLLAAVMQPPHLTCLAPGFTAADYSDGWVYQGGAFSLAFSMSWAVRLAAEIARRRGKPDRELELQQTFHNIRDWHNYLPLRDFPPLKSDDIGRYYYDWLAHPSWDSYSGTARAGWQQWSIRTRHGSIQVPALHSGGWYDVFLEGTLQNFRGIREQGATEAAQRGQHLLIGPWAHRPWAPLIGEMDFGDEARNVVDDAVLHFFDHWLKSQDNGVDRELPVQIFVMGENRWRYESAFPPRRARPAEYYLHSEGRANSSNGDGTLDLALPGDEPSDTYCHDPRSPVESVGGHSCCYPDISPMGPADQRQVEYRYDVLVFTSSVLDHDLEVTGSVSATLFASSSALDTDFTVKLVDVFPDGRAINLCDGIIRARYRNGYERAELIEPDKVYEYTIQAGSTCNVFKAGHRVRVEIASSNFPMYDRNPGHGGEIAAATYADLRPATQFVFHDARYPSHITLPVVER
jgi:putative CocE/NonD family hydrolase